MEQVDLDLLDAIHKSDAPHPGERVPLAEAARRSGLTARQISQLTDSGALVPVREGRKKLFTADDLGVMALAKRRLDAGIPIEQTVRSFSIYEKALREAVSAEVDDFAAGALMSRDVTAGAGARMIRVSDETLDTFIACAARRSTANTARAVWRTWPASSRPSPAPCWPWKRRCTPSARSRPWKPSSPPTPARPTRRLPRLPPTSGALPTPAATLPAPFPRPCAPGTTSHPSNHPARAYTYIYCLKAAWLLLAPPVLNCASAAAPRFPALPNAPRPKPCAPAPPRRGNDRPTREVCVWIFSALVARQRAYFESGATRGADFRLSALKSLREALVKNEALIFSALKADLNKAPMESYMCGETASCWRRYAFT